MTPFLTVFGRELYLFFINLPLFLFLVFFFFGFVVDIFSSSIFLFWAKVTIFGEYILGSSSISSSLILWFFPLLIKITSELNAFKKDVKAENFIFQTNKDNYDDINKQSIETFKIELKKHNTGMDNDKINIINKIALKDQISSIFYCCSKNKGKTYNIVLKESMKIINEKLDIFNIFRNLSLIEHSKNDINKTLETIRMSDECSNELSLLRNSKIK